MCLWKRSKCGLFLQLQCSGWEKYCCVIRNFSLVLMSELLFFQTLGSELKRREEAKAKGRWCVGLLIYCIFLDLKCCWCGYSLGLGVYNHNNSLPESYILFFSLECEMGKRHVNNPRLK